MILPANHLADRLPDRAQDWLWRWLGFGRSPEHRQAVRNAEAAKRFSDALMATLPPPDLMWPEDRPWIKLEGGDGDA